MGGGSNSTTTTNVPWKEAQPYYKKGFQALGGLLDSSTGTQQAYAGPRVAGFSEPSQMGLDATVATAMQGSPITGNAVGAVSNITGNMGITQPMLDVTQGANAVATGQIGANAIGSNLAGIAGNQGAIDPYTQQAIETAMQGAIDQGKAALSAKGRYGSNKATANLLTGAATKAAAPIAAQAAQQNIQNKINASSLMSNEQLANIGNMTNAGMNLADMYGDAQTRALQGAGISGAVNDLRYADANALMRAGSAYDTQQQQTLDALMAQYNENRDLPWQQLGLYGNILSGTSNNYGQQTSTQPGTSPITSAIGGAMTGTGLLGPGFGTVLGGGLGLLGGLL